MSKRALKNYLAGLRKDALEEQILDLYQRFPSVKDYYDFVFNPKEDKLLQEARLKISNEYFPVRRKRPRARRSVAQKFIKRFTTLGMDPVKLADLMLYNLEIAQSFAAERNVADAFYRSMLNSFRQAVQHISFHDLLPEFKERLLAVYQETQNQRWPFSEGFSKALDSLD